MNDDVISRQAAIDVAFDTFPDDEYFREQFVKGIEALPSAQQSRLEYAIHGKSPEEIYEFIFWLFLVYAMQFTDSRHAIINWLKGERGESDE